MKDIDQVARQALEAAAFRRLIEHLRDRTDVQNLDLMNLAGFCRNCLSRWLEEAAAESNLALSRSEAREHVYGMPYDQWRVQYQRETTVSQQTEFEQGAPHRHG